MRKSERILIRVDPEFKKELKALAEDERRSVNSMIEVCVLEYIKQKKKKEK